MTGARPFVLVVEDHADVAEGIARTLDDQGFAVELAANGREALHLLYGGFRPSIILMDLMMPVMNGYEFRQAQLANEDLSNIPLIAYSGITDVRQNGRQLQANAYLQKPFTIEALLAAVRQHCLK